MDIFLKSLKTIRKLIFFDDFFSRSKAKCLKTPFLATINSSDAGKHLKTVISICDLGGGVDESKVPPFRHPMVPDDVFGL